MVYQGQFSKQDYINAFLIQRVAFRWTRWLILGIAAGMVAVEGTIAFRDPTFLSYSIPGVALYVVGSAGYSWLYPYLVGKAMFKNGNILNGKVSGKIDDNGITFLNKNIKASILWPAFTHFKIRGDMVLLFQGKTFFNPFTKSLFITEGDWGHFLQTIAQRIGKKKAEVV
jgi:hypothetical protein